MRSSVGRAPRLDLSNPFETALVFLGHSWADNAVADRLYGCLRPHFRVWYDRAPLFGGSQGLGMSLGQPVLPAEVIVVADVAVILISEESIKPGTTSAEELEISLNVARRDGRRVGLVRVPGFEVPVQYTHLRFEEFLPRPSRQRCGRMVSSIRTRLCDLAGLAPLPGISAPTVYQGAGNPELLVNAILHPRGKGLYGLNSVLRSIEKERLVSFIAALPAADKAAVIESLVSIYLADQAGGNQVARQNAVYLVSRLEPGRLDIADLVRRRYPDENDAFLYRGFHLGLGYLGDSNRLHEYVDQLAHNRSHPWQRQRAVNVDFHVLYYGSWQGALSELRDTIRASEPTITELNVVTLGQMSDTFSDADLLDERRSDLVASGADPRLIDEAKAAIVARPR